MYLEVLNSNNKLLKAIFIYTGNGSNVQRIILLISRYTWEILQTLAGWIIVFGASLFFKRTSKLGEEGYIAHFITVPFHRGYSAVSLSGTIIVFGNRKILENTNLMIQLVRFHEFGHTIQSRYLGPLYLFVIGLPSVISALTIYHERMPWERWADKLALNTKS